MVDSVTEWILSQFLGIYYDPNLHEGLQKNYASRFKILTNLVTLIMEHFSCVKSRSYRHKCSNELLNTHWDAPFVYDKKTASWADPVQSFMRSKVSKLEGGEHYKKDREKERRAV